MSSAVSWFLFVIRFFNYITFDRLCQYIFNQYAIKQILIYLWDDYSIFFDCSQCINDLAQWRVLVLIQVGFVRKNRKTLNPSVFVWEFRYANPLRDTIFSIFANNIPAQVGSVLCGVVREFQQGWIYPHPAPEEQALRSSGGVCEPYSRKLWIAK